MKPPTGTALASLAQRTVTFLDVVPLAKNSAPYRKEADAIKQGMQRVVDAFDAIDHSVFAAKVETAAEALAAASRTNTIGWSSFTNQQREYYRGVARVVLAAVGLSEDGR